MSFVDQVKYLIEQTCSRDVLATAYCTKDPQRYAEARRDCHAAIQMMKSIICEDMQPLDKIPVVALRHQQMKDFQNVIAHNCYFISEVYQLQGQEFKDLVVIGPLANPRTSKEHIFWDHMLAYTHGSTSIWRIEEWC